jgi:hypothetical protein
MAFLGRRRKGATHGLCDNLGGCLQRTEFACLHHPNCDRWSKTEAVIAPLL